MDKVYLITLSDQWESRDKTKVVGVYTDIHKAIEAHDKLDISNLEAKALWETPTNITNLNGDILFDATKIS